MSHEVLTPRGVCKLIKTNELYRLFPQFIPLKNMSVLESGRLMFNTGYKRGSLERKLYSAFMDIFYNKLSADEREDAQRKFRFAIS